jgi:hypothetical protein
MNTKAYGFGTVILALAAIRGLPPCAAQTTYNWTPSGQDEWYSDGNWIGPQGSFVPDFNFGEQAAIANGGTAVVNGSGTSPGAVLIAQAAGTTGHVVINDMGSLAVQTAGPTSGGIIVGGAGVGSLHVSPGGTISAVGQLTSGNNINNLVTIGGPSGATASVSLGGAALNGMTRVYPNAVVAVNGTAAFGANSVFNANLTPTAGAFVDVSGAINLNGLLVLDFTGGSPAVGATWALAEASSVTGAFTSVSSSLALPLGQKLVVAAKSLPTTRTRVELSLREVAVLNVNRDTGVVSLTQPGGTTILLDSYSIQSTAGHLTPGGWNSLSDQSALGGGWIEANPTTHQIGELKSASNGSLNAGASVPLGSVYNPLGGAFGSSADLYFQYNSTENTLIEGVVKYTGTTVNNLLLQVDPNTGQARLRNTSATTVDIDGYSITSAAASLAVAGWNSLDEQNTAGGDWVQFGNATSSFVGELKASEGTTLSPGASFSLGSLFNVSGAQDLAFQFTLNAPGSPIAGEVVYEPITALTADFDGDADVDGADFLTWQRGLGVSSGAQRDDGDANGDGAVNGFDLTLWRVQFGDPAALPVVASVPEPSASIIFGIALVMCGGRRFATES